MTPIDLLLIHATPLVTCASPQGARRGSAMSDVGAITDGAVAIDQGRIVEVGPTTDLLVRYDARETLDVSGCAVCPGLVDPHTHVVHAGERIDEFELRIRGATYQEIAQAGGGIATTMRATRAASLDEIVARSRRRLESMLWLGTTMAEVKTGYGLSIDEELKLLQAIEALDACQPVELVPTFLAAHAVPPEYAGRADDYVDHVVRDQFAAALAWYRQSRFYRRGTPVFADVYCEQGAFDVEQSRRVLEAAKSLGLSLKAHVDQFTVLGGLEMALAAGAVSVDHLDVTDDEGIEALSAGNAIGVVLPTTTFHLGSHDFARARAMIDAGCALALATNANPGSSPCPSLPFAMALACRYQHVKPAEALIAATINAAHAIGMGERVGSLEAGKQADLVILDAPDWRVLAYEFGGNPVQSVIKSGRVAR